MDLRKEKELITSVAALRDLIGGSELDGKDGMREDLREMGETWKWIKATLLDSEKMRIGEEAVKVWLVELRDLAWEIEDLVGLYEYHVLSIQADEEDDDEEEEEEEEECLELSPCEEFLDTPYLLEEDFDFGRCEPERWCSKSLLDRAKANGKRTTEVSFRYVVREQNEVCPPQELTISTPIPDLPSLVKKISRGKYPRKVFIGRDGDDRSSKVTCCFYRDGHHVHIHKSLSIGDPIASSSSLETKEIKVSLAKALPSPPPPPPPPLADPSFLKEISDGARKINERFHRIADRKGVLCWLANRKLPSHNNDGSSILNRQSLPGGSLPANPDRFIGRDEQMKEIVDMLIRIDVNPAAPEVISLVGMDGIGKTTLCQHIYDHPQINEHFDLMGWINVGESFDVLSVINIICSCFTEEDVDYSDQVSKAQEKLTKQVQGKRFLLVMDDVWCEKLAEWELVLTPLLNNIPVEEGSSKILITTRSHRVAEAAGSLRSISLDLLSEEDGWCLFADYANIRIDDSPGELVDIGKGIVAKCKGLPLAIKVMGSLMRNKGDDVDSWREILNSDFSDLNGEEGGVSREIVGPLYLSYLHMPSHLKACFRFFIFLQKYCSYYDREDVQRLTDLWLAHNLIGDPYGKTWYREQGRKIIHDLASRSFLEIDSAETEDIEIRMHDMIFDLAQYVAGSEFCIEQPLSDMSWTRPTEARHLSICEEDSLRKFTLNSVVAMRTIELRPHDDEPFSYLPDFNQHPNLRFLSAYIKCLDIDFHFRHLRVLCIRGADIKVIPKSLYTLYNLIKLQFADCLEIKRVSNLIANLKNLRCLSFMGCVYLESIPQSVSKLTALEELNLLYCCGMHELPTGITRLVNLRSLTMYGNRLHWMPLGLSNLRKLNHPIHPSNFYLEHGKLHHLLNDLNSLNLKEENLHIHVGDYLAGKESEEIELEIAGKYQELKISMEPHTSVGEMILYSGDDLLNEEQILRYLKPHTDIRKLEIDYYSGARLPKWMGDQSFQQLVSLNLCNLRYCKTLSPIHKLPSLGQLYMHFLYALENVVAEEDSDVIARGKSQHPRQKPSCFPKLEELTISFCCSSMELVHVYQLTALQRLSIDSCDKYRSIEFVNPAFSMEEHRDRGNSSSHITELLLHGCGAMEVLPIYQLTALQTLTIKWCGKLKSIEFVDPSFVITEEQQDRGNSSLLITELNIICCDQLCFSSNTVPPQSLKKVYIFRCEKLRRWFESEANSKWKDIIHLDD